MNVSLLFAFGSFLLYHICRWRRFAFFHFLFSLAAGLQKVRRAGEVKRIINGASPLSEGELEGFPEECPSVIQSECAWEERMI